MEENGMVMLESLFTRDVDLYDAKCEWICASVFAI